MNISERTLDEIQGKAEIMGLYKAVRQVLDLPEFPEKELKEWAIHNFVNLSTGTTDQYFVERCWIVAYGILAKKDFYFPHIDPFICRNPVS